MSLQLSTADHWKFFHEYARYEKLTGGPDPHIVVISHLCQDKTYEEKVWRTLCHMGPYDVATAERMWSAWTPDMLLGSPKAFASWVNAHWSGLKFHRSRRAILSADKLTAYMMNYRPLLDRIRKVANADFEEVWQVAMSMQGIGRYTAIKVVEEWYRTGLVTASIPDIRAKGGWSPREGLNLITGLSLLTKDDSRGAVTRAEQTASEVYSRLEIPLTRYEFEVFLCNYKSQYKSRRQYPGRTLDSELRSEHKIRSYWGIKTTENMRARSELFPPWALGEYNGWYEPRKELETCLSDRGYTWSDAVYDYHESRHRLQDPVRRESPLA